MHLFGRMRDHDYYFGLLFAEERNGSTSGNSTPEPEAQTMVPARDNQSLVRWIGRLAKRDTPHGGDGRREDSIRQKNTPLVSRPNWAKLTFVVAEETNLNPCPVLFKVLAVTLIVAEDSKKSPEN